MKKYQIIMNISHISIKNFKLLKNNPKYNLINIKTVKKCKKMQKKV